MKKDGSPTEQVFHCFGYDTRTFCRHVRYRNNLEMRRSKFIYFADLWVNWYHQILTSFSLLATVSRRIEGLYGVELKLVTFGMSVRDWKDELRRDESKIC